MRAHTKAVISKRGPAYGWVQSYKKLFRTRLESAFMTSPSSSSVFTCIRVAQSQLMYLMAISPS